jgi:ParB family transcriptional regulator, chromosome partitioning protein
MNADMKKRGLGRGLDALFQQAKKEEEAFQPKIKRADEMAQPQIQPLAPAPQQQNNAQRRLPVEKLVPGKYQPRRSFDDAALDQLAESISAHGVIQPLLVRPLGSDRYEIIAGERRWRAAQKAQVHDVPVVVRELSDTEALEIGLVENLQRADLSAIEEAEGYQRLMDEFGHTQEKLAAQTGKSRSHVANTLRLLKLPAAVRKQVETGTLSAGHARALVGSADAERFADIIAKRGLNVRQTEKLIRDSATPEGKKKAFKAQGFTQKDADIRALEEKMTALLGLNVTIDGGASGKLVLEYKSLDQLDDVLERLSRVPKR